MISTEQTLFESVSLVSEPNHIALAYNFLCDFPFQIILVLD